MSENKRFYWLKLKEDFFDDETIRYIEEQENGIKYSNFYLKLCLKSLRTDGKLIRLVGEILIPYDVKSLSVLTGVDVDTVRCAMAIFQKIGCVQMLESGELYIAQISEMVGSETDKAKIMRQTRAREKMNGNNVTPMLPESYPDVTQSIEYRDKSTEIREKNNTPSGEARNTPSGESLPSQPTQSVENSVETVENAETRAERDLNQRLNLHAENVIGEFKISYAYFIGKPHGDIPPDKLEGIKRAIIENGLNHRHIAAYFGDNGANGTKPLYGDSDAKIYHFISPGVVEILKRRCKE